MHSMHSCVYLYNSSLAGGAMFITSVIMATVILVTRKGTSNVSKYNTPFN